MPRDPGVPLSTMVSRAIRRRCPRCGGRAFAGWYTMHEHCPDCGLRFEREPGYWVGAVTINTVVIFATFLVTFGGMILATWPDVPWPMVLAVTVVTNVAIPTLFYPMSKTIWLALEMSWHPLEPEEIAAAAARAS